MRHFQGIAEFAGTPTNWEHSEYGLAAAQAVCARTEHGVAAGAVERRRYDASVKETVLLRQVGPAPRERG
jgi:hypothetical protein